MRTRKEGEEEEGEEDPIRRIGGKVSTGVSVGPAPPPPTPPTTGAETDADAEASSPAPAELPGRNTQSEPPEIPKSEPLEDAARCDTLRAGATAFHEPALPVAAEVFAAWDMGAASSATGREKTHKMPR